MPFSKARPEMPTTQWTLIQRLQQGDEKQSRAALDELCRAYHYPLYCQIRRSGLSHHDAEDVLHEFLMKLLRLDTFGIADAEKGRLRTFLLVALRRFLATWQRNTQRQRALEVSQEALLAITEAEKRFEMDEAAHHESPDRLYDRQWAQVLIQRVLQQVRDKYRTKGRLELFEVLRPVLLSGGSLSEHCSAAMADSLGIRVGALRTALYRLLEDFNDAIRHEVLLTVETREMGKEEYESLMALFAKG